MALIYDRVVSVITKDPYSREDKDVELLINWFQNMSELFKSQTTEVVQDIVRNCEFRSVPEDTIIIRQGDRGNCFYIILKGTVSIYINQALEDEGNIKSSSETSKTGTKSSSKCRQRSSCSLTRRTITPIECNENSFSDDTVEKYEETNSVVLCTKETDDKSYDFQKLSEESFQSGSESSCAIRSIDNDTQCNDDDDDDDKSHQSLEQDENYTESSEELESDDADEHHNEQVFNVGRKLLGNHIRELDAGQSFGELALVHRNLRRNATVISDVQTDLIVVNRDLYNRSLKSAQEQEFRDKSDFVNNLPLFKTLTPRLKNVMTMSLTPVHFQYGNTIMKQGDSSQGVVFLLSGHAKISVDPIQQIKQYHWLCTDQELQFAKDIRNGLQSRLSTRPGHSKQRDGRGVPKIARRRGSYADAERELNRKMQHICVNGPSECIGDLEVLLKLPSCAYTVQCLEPIEALELNLTNFERIISKRSPNTLTIMRQMAETKLRSRVSRLANEQIYCAVMHRMLDILEEQNTPASVKAARRKEEEEATVLQVLQVPSWHNYRDKQRQFLNKRERDRRQRENQAARMDHASRLTLQMRRINSDEMERGLKFEESNEAQHLDKDVIQFVRRLTIDMARSLEPANIPRQRRPTICTHSSSESLLRNRVKREYQNVHSTRRGSSSTSSSV